MKKILLSMALAVFLATAVQAQNSGAGKNGFAAKVLFIDYETPNDDVMEDLNITNGFELTYVRNLTPWLNFGIPVKLGVIDVENDINNRTFASFDGVLQVQYAKNPTSRLVPYLMGGAGYVFESDGENNAQFPLGGGLNIRLGKSNSFITVQGEYRISQTENRSNLQGGIGYFQWFGKMDADGDGVADALDRCPDQPGSADTEGCPDQDLDGIANVDDECPLEPGTKRFQGCPDTDNDGVADRDDKCPQVPGTADMDGCPDSDMDGIADADDDCPNMKGVASANGCPDADGDGVADASDKCPKQKGDAAYGGCPFEDRDRDGVADAEDKCPDTAGSKGAMGCPDADNDGVADKDDLCPGKAGTMAGCPDTDGDGVHDGIDACPDQMGLASNRGCPEIKEEDRKVLEFAMSAVQFQTGKATLKAESNSILNQIVGILNNYPAYKLKINGHTDSVGDADNNQRLSGDRAKACYDYLRANGIPKSRMTYRGFGETQPIATNDTSSGRRQNRRVEFDLYLD